MNSTHDREYSQELVRGLLTGVAIWDSCYLGIFASPNAVPLGTQIFASSITSYDCIAFDMPVTELADLTELHARYRQRVLWGSRPRYSL